MLKVKVNYLKLHFGKLRLIHDFANDKYMFNLKVHELEIILGKLIMFSFVFSMFSTSEVNTIYCIF